MVVNSLALVAGISLLFRFTALPTSGHVVLLVSGSLLTLALLYFLIQRPAKHGWCTIGPQPQSITSGFIPFVFVLIGFVYSWFYTQLLMQQRLPDTVFNRDITIHGRVAGSSERDGRRLRFLFRVTQVDAATSGTLSADDHLSGLRSLVRLNWYGDDSPMLRDGDRLQLVVKLRQPSGFLNPGGFDYEKWLFQNHIMATGYVREADKARASWSHHRSLQQSHLRPSFASIRAWLTERIRLAASGYQQHGVILALAVGDRTDIEPGQWQRFIATGTNHLLAISGLHITLVATAAGLLFRLLWLQSKLLRRFRRQSVVITAALVGAFVYSAMAGFSIPTQRALIMYVVLAVFILAQRHHKRLAALSIALVAVTLWNPLSVLSAGFWMSFCAVAILYLVYSSAPRQGFWQKLSGVLRGHLFITLGLYPATVLLFQQASLVAPVANFVCVPLVGLVITPAVFLSALTSTVSVELAALLLYPVDWLLGVMSAYLGFLATLPLAIVSTGQVSIPILSLVVVAVLLAIMPYRPGVRWLLVPLLLPLIFSRSDNPEAGSYRVTFLDVGQGSAVIVRTANRVLVYDTGAQFSASFNAADAVIIPYLRSHRIDTLDALVVSHSDNDHSGGVDELLEHLHVDKLWHSQPLVTFMDSVPEVDNAGCESGIAWHWDDVRFEFLHPPPNFNASDNNLSCVLRITSASGERTLLTGDIEREAEALLLSIAGPADILMVPHHGSLTSSSIDFVGATRPKFAVYTVGHNNRFGFPKPEVIQRYHSVGTRQISTSASGASTFLVGNGVIKVGRYRVDRQKIWNREADDVSAMTATLK